MLKQALKLGEFKFRRWQGKQLALNYFHQQPNVGDSLNLALIQALSGRQAVLPPRVKSMPHLLAVGSVLARMNHRSVVWGSGIISEAALSKVQQLGDIRALRGFHTRTLIEKKFHVDLQQLPLGDPAILIPEFFPLKQTTPEFSFGLVAHYVDVQHPFIAFAREQGGHIIDVGLNVADFVRELQRCECILSSSMHGLILSDAYGIKNHRLVLSDKIIGGDFKFGDYYSTTDQPQAGKTYVSGDLGRDTLQAMLKKTSVKHFALNKAQLKAAFPHDFR